ncbi:Aldehyde dehydrogenase family 1 member A3, partial [Frankliniella fusca]
SLITIIGVFIDNGQVCSYYNVPTNGRSYESGDIIELPYHGKETSVLKYVTVLSKKILVSENLGQATAAAMLYFKRLCKWDNVQDLSSVKLFGYDAAVIEEEVSQIAMFATQDNDGPLLYVSNAFDLLELTSEDSQN